MTKRKNDLIGMRSRNRIFQLRFFLVSNIFTVRYCGVGLNIYLIGLISTLIYLSQINLSVLNSEFEGVLNSEVLVSHRNFGGT